MSSTKESSIPESLDSDSSYSEVRQSVQLMAQLEQEVTPEITGEGTGAQPQPQPADQKEWVPNDEWNKMSKSQRKHFLRKRRKERGDAPSTSNEKTRAEGGTKRPRDATSFTPSPNKVERKKPRTEGVSFSHMVSSVKVAIVGKDHPHEELSQETCEKIVIKLLDLMGENNPDERLISFCGYNIRSGAIVVNCMDEGSKEWLIHSINKISPWEGTDLRTCDPKELEGFKKVSTFVPKPIRKIEEILNNLKRQNGLDTGRWRILPKGVKNHPNGVYFVASIPESHHKVILGKGGKLAHGFHLVEFKELTKAQEEPKPEEGKPKEKKETGEVGDQEMAEAAGGEAAALPECRAPFDRTGADLVDDQHQSLDGGGGAGSSGVKRGEPPGASVRTGAAGNRRDPKKVPGRPGRDPPSSS